MKITRVEPIVLRLPAVDAGRADGTQDAFLVRVHTDEGIAGIGEADTAPLVAAAIVSMPPSHAIARGLGELLVGEDPLAIDRLWRLMYQGSSYYGRSGAALHVLSGVDMALWDLAGKAAGRPVSDLLGGSRLDRVPVYASEVMPQTEDGVRAIAERAVGAGYGALKLGWGPLGSDLAHDERLIRAARDVLGPERDLMIDGGQAYTVKSARELLRRVDDAGLYWLEEPLRPDDYDGYRKLAESTPVRIAAGEEESSRQTFLQLMDKGRIDVVQVDLTRCGGFTEAMKIAALAWDRGLPVANHGFTTYINVAAALHWLNAIPNALICEFVAEEETNLRESITRQKLRARDGYLDIPQDPGLGIDLDEDAIERYRVA